MHGDFEMEKSNSQTWFLLRFFTKIIIENTILILIIFYFFIEVYKIAWFSFNKLSESCIWITTSLLFKIKIILPCKFFDTEGKEQGERFLMIS